MSTFPISPSYSRITGCFHFILQKLFPITFPTYSVCIKCKEQFIVYYVPMWNGHYNVNKKQTKYCQECIKDIVYTA
jgi:hypothetical protein